jgi:APA family basic amino acid/polyamine antiporter
MAEQKLHRTLGLAECVFFATGSILGAGIYAIIGKIAGFSGNMIWLSFGFASLTALMTAFSYAELSSMYPHTGGEYVYVKEAFNEKIGSIVGYIISISGAVSGATVAIGFAGYFSQLLSVGMIMSTIGIIVLVLLINVSGIRKSSLLNIIFTIIEVSGLGLVIYVAWPYIGDVNYLEIPPGGINHVLLASALSFFAFMGFEEIVKLSEETKNAERTIPRALFISSIIVTILYTIVALCAVSAIPWEQLKESSRPLSDIVKQEMGTVGATIIAFIALFSTTNTILSNMMGSSRVMLNMSREKKWLKKLNYISPKRKTPVRTLIVAAILMICFALIGKLERVALMATFFVFITFLFVNLSVIILRIRQKTRGRPYRIPVNINNIPLPSLLGIILTLVLFSYTMYGLAISAV